MKNKRKLWRTYSVIAIIVLAGLAMAACENANTSTPDCSAGHSWGQWRETIAPTCTEDGVETRTCQICGETQTETAFSGHEWGEWEVIDPPTDSEQGKREHTCIICDETDTDTIPPTHDHDRDGHLWSAWEEITPPTKTELGEERHTCQICDETETRLFHPGTGGLVYELLDNNEGYEVTDYTGSESDVIIALYHNDLPVVSIGNNALFDMSLTSVTILDNVTRIGDNALRQNQLTAVTFGGGVETIGINAFTGNQLTTLTISDSVVTIGNNAFHGAASDGNALTDVTLGNSVQTIGEYAFAGNQLTTLTIPDSVVTIGAYAFHSNALTGVTLGNSVRTIANNAFERNRLEGTLIIPDSVTDIGVGAFTGDPYVAYNQLTGVTLGNSVQTIGNYAFSNNRLEGTLIIPASVTGIGTDGFAGDPNVMSNGLTGITILAGENKLDIGNNAFGHNRLEGTLIIPASVTSIGIDAFTGRANGSTNQLTGVTILAGENELVIGYRAFDNNKLTGDLIIPDNVISIGYHAFKGTPGTNQLTGLTIGNGVTTIGYGAFANNPIENVTFAEGSRLTTITGNATANNGVFEGTALTRITIPASVTTIGARTFMNISTLQEVTFEEGSLLENIGTFDNTNANSGTVANLSVFRGCTNLREITLPAGLANIGVGAFGGTSFDRITIPENVVIYKEAFTGWTAEQEIYIPFAAWEDIVTFPNTGFGIPVPDSGWSVTWKTGCDALIFNNANPPVQIYP